MTSPGPLLDAIDGGDQPVFDEADAAAAMEIAMLDIWKDEIWAEDIRTGDDFFSVGGDSLAAVRITIRVRDTFGVDIPISQLLETPILRDFAKHVQRLRTGEARRQQDSEVPQPPDIEEGIV